MQREPTPQEVREMLAQLRENPEAIAWTERRHVPRSLVALCQSGSPAADGALELLQALALDSKWEVRKAVADVLRAIPDETMTRTLAGLCDDPNTFVRRAAEAALARRRSGAGPSGRGRGGMWTTAGRLAQIEQIHGPEIARLAREIGEMYFDQLVGATVHDARGILTPLTSKLSRLIEQVDRGSHRPVRLRRSLQLLLDRVNLLTRLVEDVRRYSSPIPPARRPERLADILAEAERLAREAAEAGGYEVDDVVVTSPNGEITVEVARDRMLMAFTNVLKNAFESFPDARPSDGRRVQIDIHVMAGSAIVTIADNGVGMSKEDLTQVCEFLPGAKTKKDDGTGFGLPIARRNIGAHGGSLTIQSEEGHGTTVTIALPLEQEDGEACRTKY